MPGSGRATRSGRSERRRRGLALLALAALLGACRADDLEAEHAAALRAIECLLDAAPGMDPLWSVTTFDRLYKIAPTEELARRIRGAFDAAMSQPIANVPDEPDARALETDELRRLTTELWRRRMTGAPWEEPAAALEALVVEQEEALWEGKPHTQQLVFLYLLGRIDVETRLTLADVASQLHYLWETKDREQLAANHLFLYPVTHVIYAESGYGDRYLAAADFPVEADILDAALRRWAAGLPDHPMFIHLASEVVASRRFLKLPEDEAARAVKGQLLARQGAGGCWRPGTGNESIHSTREAVHALIRLPAELRPLEPTSGAAQ